MRPYRRNRPSKPLVEQFKLDLLADGDPTRLADWQLDSVGPVWNGSRLFQAAKFVTEMGV